MKPSVLLGALLACLALTSAAAPLVPTFLARRDYAGLYSNWVQVADMNGDGIPDLIGILGGIEVLFGNGNGTFRSGPSAQTVMSYARSFVTTDLNGDGKVDVVMAGEVVQGPLVQWGIGVSLGNGDGTFQSGVFYAAGTDTEVAYLTVGDFNGDGRPDVVTAGSSGVWLFTGKGDGTFNPGVLAASLPTSSGQLAATDFNGDHTLDLVVTMPAGGTDGAGAGFAVLLGNGDGSFQTPQTFAQPKKGAVTVGNLTKGGYPSIALSTVSNQVYLYYGNGAGGFSGPRRVYLPGGGGIVIGDVNGDGIPDLVSGAVDIALGSANGTFQKPIHYPVQGGGGVSNLVLADLRNNGLTDIVTNSSSAVSVLLSLGKGKYEDGKWITVSGGAGCGVAADYNGDGNPDLAVNNAQGVSILLGTGSASSPFSTGATIPLANAGCLVTGDLNGDGIPDLLVPSGTAVVAFLGNGDGTFTQKSTTSIPTGGYVVLADFNHDGKLDFATSGNLLALGNGDGTFQAPAPFMPSPPQPQGDLTGIATGDLNGDGWPDLVLTNGFQNYIYILINNQHGGFSQSRIQPPVGDAYDPAQIALADLNGDGNLDAITASIYGGGAAVYLGNGKGGLTYEQGLSDPVGALGPLVVADVNGDGIPDISLEEAGTVAIYLGNGNGTFETPFYIGAGAAPGDILVENLHGQLPAAGLPDIVAPDNSGGVMVLINKTK
jgi:VCBS repeat protein